MGWAQVPWRSVPNVESRISIVTLGVRHLERSVRFYRDGLGWPLSIQGPGAPMASINP